MKKKIKIICGALILYLSFHILYFIIGIIQVGQNNYIIINKNKITKVIKNINPDEADRTIYWIRMNGLRGYVSKYSLESNSEIDIKKEKNSKAIAIIPTSNVIIQGTVPKIPDGFFDKLSYKFFSEPLRVIPPWCLENSFHEYSIKASNSDCVKLKDSLYAQVFRFTIISTSQEQILFYKYNNNQSKQSKITIKLN